MKKSKSTVICHHKNWGTGGEITSQRRQRRKKMVRHNPEYKCSKRRSLGGNASIKGSSKERRGPASQMGENRGRGGHRQGFRVWSRKGKKLKEEPVK